MQSTHRSIFALSIALAACGRCSDSKPRYAAPTSTKSTVIRARRRFAKELLHVRFPKPKNFTLRMSTGLPCWQGPQLPHSAASIAMQAGSLFETKPGVAEMTAVMLEEGTRLGTSSARGRYGVHWRHR